MKIKKIDYIFMIPYPLKAEDTKNIILRVDITKNIKYARIP